jgi:glycosyl transferase family 87
VRYWSRWAVVAALTLATLNFVHFAPRDTALRPPALNFDFRAFYCAGFVANDRADPYRAEPLRTCERSVGDQYPRASNVVLPAPLPGYVVALFGLLARLPFGVAGWVWSLLLLVAVAVTVVALRAVTGLPLATIIAAVGVADGWATVVLGQPVPLVVAGVALCGWQLERKRFVWAGLAAALTLLEPHMGLPVCIATFLFVPQTRAVLAACVALAFAGSIAVLGTHESIEYVARVLPAQVAAEAAAQEQYSLTYVLHRLGADDADAVAAGNISYALAVLLGLMLARRLARETGGAAFVPFIPAGAAVVGGPYVHLHQIAAAMPAALLCVARAPLHRRAFVSAVVLLAVPWGRFLDLRSALLFVGVACAVLVWQLDGKSLGKAIATALASMAFVYAAVIAVGQRSFDDTALAGFGAPTLLASSIWASFIRAIDYPLRTDVTFLVMKIPTYVGLGLLAYGVTSWAFAHRRLEMNPSTAVENASG